jgi:type IV pilus assembly protein PilN
MMEINLLPHREARRAADLRESIALLILGLVVLVGCVFFLNSGVKNKLTGLQANVAQLEADITRYKPQQALVEKFKNQKKELQDKLDIITTLDHARKGPVRILDELSSRVPERLWLTRITTKGTAIRLEGQSLDTGVVADFLRSLNASAYFKDVDLDKTTGGKVVEGVRLVNFEIRADMTSSVEKTENNS